MNSKRAHELLTYDPDTGNLFWKRGSYGWIRRPGVHAGTFNGKGYRIIKLDRNWYMVHRIIWLMIYGNWPSEQVDHIDRDKLNNRIENLREASAAQNCANQLKRKTNTSGYKGVTKYEDKWRSTIFNNGFPVYLGIFNTAEEAFAEYKRASIELNKEFSPFKMEEAA